MKTLMISATALALLPAAAFAAPADLTTVVKVRIADTDLTNVAGAQRAIARLDGAALEACGASHFSLREYKLAVRNSDCYRDGMDRAVASLGSPTLNAVYQRSGTRLAAR
jgi:UrcA family protein